MLVSQIYSVVQWLTANVCSKITLKVPDDHQNDAALCTGQGKTAA